MFRVSLHLAERSSQVKPSGKGQSLTDTEIRNESHWNFTLCGIIFSIIKLKISCKEHWINQNQSGCVSGPTQIQRDHISLNSSKCIRQQNTVSEFPTEVDQQTFQNICRHTNDFLPRRNEQDTHCRAGQLRSVSGGGGDSTAIHLFAANGACWQFTKSATSQMQFIFLVNESSTATKQRSKN